MLLDVVANAREVVGRGFCPADSASTRIPAVDDLADVFMVNELAAVGSG